jgi:acetyl esterase
MKKFTYAIAVIVGAIAILVAVVYRWTFTPYGRLNPLMAIIHRVMHLASLHGFFDRDNLEQVRRNLTLVRPRVAIHRLNDRRIPGPSGEMPMRIYTPVGGGPFPIIVYFHGGGFSIGSIESHENITRSIANATSSVVVSVDYRLAPEHPFPAAFDDAYTAVQWVAENAQELNGDPDLLAVAGDSAGGNLAAAVCLKARDEQGPNIRLQILLYATTILTDMDLVSRENFLGYVISEESGRKVVGYYCPDEADRLNPYASPLLAEDHSNLPAAYVMTAGFDPLLDEGKLYADKLEAAGVPVHYRNYEGMLHGFLSFGDLVYFLPMLNRMLREPEFVYQDITSAVREWLIPKQPVREKAA